MIRKADRFTQSRNLLFAGDHGKSVCPPAAQPGLLVYILVDSVAVNAVVANGGEIVQPIGADAPEITARFRDPAGNVIGLYEQPNAAQ
jgi:predicted enzyme related to lactoylglutathione lyase